MEYLKSALAIFILIISFPIACVFVVYDVSRSISREIHCFINN